MTYRTTITSKGQVTVPIAIRKKLGLQPGQSVEFFYKNGRATLKPNDWQAGIARVQAKASLHLKRRGVKQLSDAQLDKLIDKAARSASVVRHQRIIKS